MAASPPARRRRDPQRRIAEIVEATQRVIAARGIEGLSHRVVAEEAGVALGATTHHFASKDELIQAALQQTYDQYAGELQEWAAQRPTLTPEQLTVLLADALVSSFGPDRGADEIVEVELYTAALRRPALRPLVDKFTQATTGLLARYVDPSTARAATAAMNGLSLTGLAGAQPPTRDEVEDTLRRILTPNPSLPTTTQPLSTCTQGPGRQ
ncbi:TetR family transcriptional regulator [Streptosporangium nondiastaticum]|uniref:TetR family transcriptional regulator n=2 Tax=Streptosporangium nondiastaticum TaxID=35764 RepID=A0A9X7JNQ7_9ACTN|nr:TetR family transcriptional regulator [Streptosporangium nondiastaticum]